MLRINGKFPEPGGHAVFSKELTHTRLHVLSPRCHDYRASDQNIFAFYAQEKPRERIHSQGFSLRSIHVLTSAHKPVRQLIDTRLNLLSRSLCDRRAATNLTQLIMNHAVRLTRTNRPRRHILRQLIA